MNRILKIMGFVVAMGVITSTLLIGMDVLTSERITRNEQALFQSKVLDAFEIEYNTSNIYDTFMANVEEVELTLEGESVPVYRNPETGSISFQIEGGGVWGPIIGVLTLNEDLATIENVGILAQQETPGLGGRIVELPYLAKYEGVVFDPIVEVLKEGAQAPNQVDAITGATSTSSAFQTILNNSYEQIIPAYQATLGGE